MESIKWTVNQMPKTADENLKVMGLDEVSKARAFHESFPQYSVTPLAKLTQMASLLGLGEVYVKDESYRFGLNAFKVLGGSFAMARYIAKQTGKDVSELPYNVLTSEALKKEFGQATFFTATDGNHGRGVAWAANKLGQKAVVLMPKGTTQTRLNNILAEGAQATIEEYNYDECVRMANAMAEKTEHGVMVQDTAWDGATKRFRHGSCRDTELWQWKPTISYRKPDAIARLTYLSRAGVGSLAGAVQGYFANRYPENPPKVVVVEAEAAACLYKGATAGDGKIRIVDGDMETIMAGLACGEPNTISWDILKNHVDTFIASPDWVAAKGMRMLAAPIKGDPQVTSGESGAAPFGTLACIMTMDEYKPLREHLGLGKDSKVLLFSTEGDTDPGRYKSIVWDGNEK